MCTSVVTAVAAPMPRVRVVPRPTHVVGTHVPQDPKVRNLGTSLCCLGEIHPLNISICLCRIFRINISFHNFFADLVVWSCTCLFKVKLVQAFHVFTTDFLQAANVPPLAFLRPRCSKADKLNTTVETRRSFSRALCKRLRACGCKVGNFMRGAGGGRERGRERQGGFGGSGVLLLHCCFTLTDIIRNALGW